MLSELDMQLQAVLDRLTASGGPFETGHVVRFGRRLPVFETAPPTLPALFAHYCALHRDKEFVVDGALRLTFGDVHALAKRAAAGLVLRHGVARGERVCIAAANSANWIIAYMAVLMAGGCATLLNAWWAGDELAAAIRLSECKLVLADAERADRLAGCGTGARVVHLGAGAPEQGLAALLAGEGEAARLPRLTSDDIATILFTSGSTGASKAAVSDHRAVVHAAMNFAVQGLMIATQLIGAGRPANEREAALLTVPLFHATGAVTVLLKSFFAGRKLVIMPKWDAAEAMRLIEAERITFFTGVPLMSHEIASHPGRGDYDLSSCTYFAAGGAAQPAAHGRRIREAMAHAFALQGYGLTETNGAGCINFTENYLDKPDSTGPASKPLIEIAIIGPEGEALPAGTTGEIAVRSVANFRGYWNDDAATAAAIRPDGFFLTGDLGRLDAAGYLYIIDRKKDIIIRGGENIAAVEVERAIYSHPGVAEASVFGLPDERYGEVPVAVYHTKAGERLDARELQRHLAERIAAFKIPVQFWEQDQALPRLGAEKVDKRALKDRYAPMWAGAKR
jgi:acyl-CoA synthetase (AMP-forming)/AMP-acid ligase II